MFPSHRESKGPIQSCYLASSSGAGAHPEELAETRVVRLARLSLCIFEILCKPEANHFKHSIEGLIGCADGDESVGCIEVGPVLEIWSRLQELGGERESNGGEVRDPDESTLAKSSISMVSMSS